MVGQENRFLLNIYLYSENFMIEKKTAKRRFLNRLGKVGVAALTFSLMTSSASAVDPVDAAGQVVASEGGRIATKEALNTALKFAKSKPSMVAATTVVCVSCIPVAGMCASASMCVACGILIAKTLG